MEDFWPPQPTTFLVGRTEAAGDKLILGRYRPLRPLGTGGSGSVWLVLDERSGREVALKIVPREGNAGTRAEREAATAARLRHERCLKAFTLSRDEEHVYIAYEYVPGKTLRELLRAGKIGDPAALEIAVQVLDGLAHAHKQGIVHRDVKPSNVLLASGPGVSAHLLDFGLALIKEEETLTAIGDVPGTLAYISPERLRGQTATPAADVWSVGVLLWEILAGRHPFWKPSLLQTARSIQSGPPSLAKARPDLPKRVSGLVDRALAVDPAKRPSAAKLSAALRRAEVRPRKRRPAFPAPGVRVPRRLVPALLAGLYALYGASALPFYPQGSPAFLAIGTAALAALRPRFGLAFALAVPVLPLGNVGSAPAVLYGIFAALWLACWWRRPGRALLFAVGPLLGPAGALALLPLLLERAGGPVRRAALGALGVLSAGVTAGLTGRALPFTDDPAPGPLPLAGSDHPLAAAAALRDVVVAEPALLRLALVVAAASAAVSVLRRRSPWLVALYGSVVLACSLLPPAGVAALPLAVTVWATCAVLWLREERICWRTAASRLPVPVRVAQPNI